jgi:hypothetical protein
MMTFGFVSVIMMDCVLSKVSAVVEELLLLLLLLLLKTLFYMRHELRLKKQLSIDHHRL